jgi:hypothetical protein
MLRLLVVWFLRVALHQQQGDLSADPDAPAVFEWDVPVTVVYSVRVSSVPDATTAQAQAQNMGVQDFQSSPVSSISVGTAVQGSSQ